VAGISSITATINGSSQSVDVNFIADSGTAGIAEGDLVTVDNNAIANDSATNSVQATVKDSNDNPVENQRVDFYASNGASIVASDTTDTTGNVRVTLTSKTAGNSTVTATVNGQSRTT
jgi:adhesin/invasin